jgi:hypothetical protein
MRLDDVVATGLDSRAPVETFVVVPVIGRRGNHPGEVDARRLESRDSRRQVDKAALVAPGLPPKRFAHGDGMARTDNRRECSGRVADVSPDECCTQAKRSVVRAWLERDLLGISDLDRDQVVGGRGLARPPRARQTCRGTLARSGVTFRNTGAAVSSRPYATSRLESSETSQSTSANPTATVMEPTQNPHASQVRLPRGTGDSLAKNRGTRT